MNLVKKQFSLIILVCIHLILLSSLKFTAWPEMLAYPYLLSRGFNFYQDIVHPYLPLLPYFILGVSYITGFTVFTLQIITYLVLVISDILIWKITREWLPQKFAILAVGSYALLTVIFDSNGLWFDVFSVPFLISTWYLFWLYLKSSRPHFLYWTCFILGIAFLIKQTILVYMAIVISYILFRKLFRISFISTILFLLPFFGVLVFFPFNEVWQWGIVFPLTAITRLPGYILYPSNRQLVNLVITLSPIFFWYKSGDQRLQLLVLWFGASLLFLYPRFDYFHMQPLLPFFVLGTALVLSKIRKTTTFYVLSGIYLVVVGGWGMKQLARNFNQPPRFFSRNTYVLASYIDKLLPNNEPIFFYNTTANFIVASGLLPTKPWVDNFPWYMELPGMQEKIIEALEKQKVHWVVYSQIRDGGLYELGLYRPTRVNQYIETHFVPESSVTDEMQILKRRL